MNILIIGDEQRTNEFKTKIKLVENITLQITDSALSASVNELNQFEAIFDLSFNGNLQSVENYRQLQNRIVVLNATTNNLHQFYSALNKSNVLLAGMNCLPGFIDKPLAELSVLNEAHQRMIEKLFHQLQWQATFVADRIGLVTPRVVCMIINEAFFTLQENTASINDIDTAMKLGTNYPYGPFEWLKIIGVKNVYTTLEAIYNDTHDERYKICPMLRTAYLEVI